MGEGFTMGEETYDLEGGNGEMAFSDKTVRRGFIKKVYAIISVQVRLDQKRSSLKIPSFSSWSLLDLSLSSIKATKSSEF